MAQKECISTGDIIVVIFNRILSLSDGRNSYERFHVMKTL